MDIGKEVRVIEVEKIEIEPLLVVVEADAAAPEVSMTGEDSKRD